MKAHRSDTRQRFVIATTAFLHGIVVGAAGFALCAHLSGILQAGPFFLIFLITGLGIAGGLASLPQFVGDRIESSQKLKALADRNRILAQSGHAEPGVGADSR